MKKRTILALLSLFFGVFCTRSAFAGPFGIDMGMSLEQVRAVCKTEPEHIRDGWYLITPPKTHNMFEAYGVRIDPEYGVYMLKAVGKDIYTNGYGEDLKVVFEELVQSIRNTYGEESKRTDGLQEGSIWSDPDRFMYALSVGDRSLSAVWLDRSYAQAMVRKFSGLIASAAKEREVSDTTGMNALILSQLRFPEKLPNNVGSIIVEAKAKSPTEGYLVLDYYFSNQEAVEAKAASVF